MKIPKIENHTKGEWAKKIINDIIWGESHFNPNKEEELKVEAQRLTQHND